MGSNNRKMPVFFLFIALSLCFNYAIAQTKPAESTSKVKKVLLYNKIGGWVPDSGIAAVKGVLSKFSEAKGFDLVQLDDDSVITLKYLKQFQVIVWNNNTDGARSMPRATARQAVLDYLDQGGGWMVIHRASDHYNSWAGLSETMGTKLSRHAGIGRAEVVMDEAAGAHRELQWMVGGFPDFFELDDLWFNFMNTVRPLPGVTVVATARGIPGSNVARFDMEDRSGDNVYIWAREVGRGRFLYNAIGFGQYEIMEQQDSIVPRMYWENLRYLAGDYQNGCTTPSSPNFDPAARVHIEAMCAATGVLSEPTRTELSVTKGALRMRLPSPEGRLRVRLQDLRGKLVMDRLLPAGTRAITLDGTVRPGVYHLEVQGDEGAFQRRLALP